MNLKDEKNNLKIAKSTLILSSIATFVGLLLMLFTPVGFYISLPGIIMLTICGLTLIFNPFGMYSCAAAKSEVNR